MSDQTSGYVHVHKTCPKCDGCVMECEHQVQTTMTTSENGEYAIYKGA